MFVRIKRVRSGARTYRYLHIVENRWEQGRTRQHIVGSLGRLEDLQARGHLERVIRQLVEHCPGVELARAQAAGTLQVVSDKLWGPVLVFERLWEELGLKELLAAAARRRRFGFDFERVVFAQVLQRFLEPGSDLRGSKWVGTVQAEDFERLRLSHFYRSLGPLWERKQRIEEALYQRGLDLFNQELDLVFFDTTSTYFEGTTLRGWAKLGKSKDHRPDHGQLVIGVVLRRDGFPVCCEVWPGNTADMTTVLPILARLKERFRIRRVIFVCDRGMVSKANLQALTAAGYQYIVGVKMRGLVEVRDEVLGRAGRYHVVGPRLEVKEVRVGDRRYVVCYNPEEAEKDRHDRAAILEKIEKKLRSGGVKALLSNRGYKRFLKVQQEAAAIDRQQVAKDARYDGKFVLRTTTQLPAAAVAEAYKQLTSIERLWREMKDVLEVRPNYHWQKRDHVKGHIFTVYLALYLSALLRRKLREAGIEAQWDEVIRDLSSLRAVTVELAGEHYLMRSPLQGCAGKVLAAVGVKAPSLAQPA
ncbi:MAG: IS1634 family transposase [bacterium]|nr:IS1634 family transposase [bacterium]